LHLESDRLPSSCGEITGVLKQMTDTMEENFADVEVAEAQAFKD